MNTDKQNNLLSITLITLLLLQVLISVAVISKLNKLEQVLITSLSNLGGQPEVPGFISDVSLDDDPRLGVDNAKIIIVEFADYECPYCAEATSSIERIMLEYKGQILFVYRDFPLENIHPHAFQAAEAANCAGDQGKYWEMHDILYKNQMYLDVISLKNYAGDLGLNIEQFNQCLDNNKYSEEIQKDIEDGLKYQVNGTPTFFINGHRVVGGSYEQLKSTIELLIDK